MAEATTSLARAIDAFDRARGEEQDGVWALQVCFAMLTRDVRDDVVRDDLEQVLEVVRATQESPEQLFGPAREHAAEAYARWCAEGRAVWSLAGSGSVRETVGTGLQVSAAVTVGVWLLGLLRGEPSPSLGHLLLPPCLGLAAMGLPAWWDRLSRRRAAAVAVPGFVAAVIGVSAAVGSLLMLTRDASPAEGIGGWLLPVEAAALWAAGALLGRWSAAGGAAGGADSARLLTDDEWSRRLAGILRGPGWWPDARVRELVAEARSHAAESGRSPGEEFGAPEEYAARLGPDRVRRRRLVVAALLVLAGVCVVLSFDGHPWRGLVMAGLFGCMAWSEHRRR